MIDFKNKEQRGDLVRDFAEIINKNGLENDSNTPDHLIAEHLVVCLEAYNNAIAKRNDWFRPNEDVDTLLKKAYDINPLEPRHT